MLEVEDGVEPELSGQGGLLQMLVQPTHHVVSHRVLTRKRESKLHAASPSKAARLHAQKISVLVRVP
jgi:hypothetical protein